jgi:2-dehydro-3-deoxygalactonokinase
MNPLIAVDWGTSSLRVARLDGWGRAIEEREFARGILTVPPGGFPQVFDEACGDWMKPSGALALVCGMAGSRQGWVEAPYVPCPAGIGEVAARLTWIVPRRIALVPGLSFERDGIPDVMRGEETKVIGVLHATGDSSATIVMPGTHCKWVRAREGRTESFATFMTGEFYALLRQHSILGRTMAAGEGGFDRDAFLRGVDHAARTGNLLHAAFSARTLSLFERLTAHAGASYLSGLLVGEELRTQRLAAGETLVLVGAEKLTHPYGIALDHLGAPFRTLGQDATWLGLHAIARCMRSPS